MSCGTSHGQPTTDCSDVLERVFFFLDNELDQADCSEIQQHLDECGPCLQQYDLERTVKSLVARSCSEGARDAAPAGAAADPPGAGRDHRGTVPARLSRPRRHETPTPWSATGSCRVRARRLDAQALGRLPWLAPFFLRARRLRPVLPMVSSSTLDVAPARGQGRSFAIRRGPANRAAEQDGGHATSGTARPCSSPSPRRTPPRGRAPATCRCWGRRGCSPGARPPPARWWTAVAGAGRTSVGTRVQLDAPGASPVGAEVAVTRHRRVRRRAAGPLRGRA